MGKSISQLSEQDRSKLDKIVQKMIADNESDANIRFVVDDFKKLYGKKKDPSIPPSSTGGDHGNFAGQSNGLVPTGIETDTDKIVAQKWKQVMSPVAKEGDYDPNDPIASVKKIAYGMDHSFAKATASPSTSESTGQKKPISPVLPEKKSLIGIKLNTKQADEIIKNFESQYSGDTNAALSHIMKSAGVDDPETLYAIPDDQLEKLARPGNNTDFVSIERIKDARNVRKAMSSANSIEQMAAAYAGLNDPQTAKQIESGSISIPQENIGDILAGTPNKVAMGDPRNIFSEATLGKMMFDFMNNSATMQEVLKKPELQQSFRDVTPMLIQKYPDFGKALLGNIISQKMEDMGINNSILNVVTKEETDKAVEELVKEGKFSVVEQKFYQDQMRESGLLNLGKKLINRQTYDTPGLLENAGSSFTQGAKDIYKGAAEFTGIRQAYLGDQLLNARDMADRDNAVNVEAKGVWNEIGQFGGQFLGQSYSLGATGKLLNTIKAVKNIETAVAVAGGIQAYGNYIGVARQLFPDDQLKQRGYATILAGIEMATENIFKDAKVVEGITGNVAPELKTLITSFTPERLASLEGRQTVKEIVTRGLKNVPEFTRLAAKASAENVVEEDASQLGQQIVDGLFKGKKLEDYINGEEMWNTTRQAFLGSPHISLLSARADMLRTKGITARSVLDMARNPQYWRGQFEEYAKLDSDFAASLPDKVANLNHAANVAQTVDGLPLSERQKAKYVITSLNSFVRNQAAKGIADPVLQKREKAAIAENDKVQEELLDGKDDGRMEGDTFEPNEDQVKKTQKDPDDNIIVNDIVDKPGSYKGKPGMFFMDGQSLIFKMDGQDKEWEIGNINEIGDKNISDMGIEYSESVVSVAESGNINVRGNEYINNYSDPMSAVNRNDEGDVVSVNLETADGKKRTFRGNIAEDIAYQITLQQIDKSNESKSEFEQFLNTSPAVKQEFEYGPVQETAETVTNKDTQGVSQVEEKSTTTETKQRTIDDVESEITKLENDLYDLEFLKDDPDENISEINADIEVGQQQLEELYKERDSITQNNTQNEQEERQKETLLKSEDASTGPAENPPALPPPPPPNPFEQEWKQPKGRYKVVPQNGKRVVKSKNGRVVPEYVEKEVRKKGGLVVKQKIKNPIWNRVTLQHAKTLNYNHGKTAEQSDQPQNFSNEQEANIWIIENSENPSEIASAYLNLQKEAVPLSSKDDAIARNMGKVKGSSFKMEGDANNVTLSIAKTYFSKTGETIDQIALAASDYGDGLDISPSDVVDFMMRFPNGVDPDGVVKTPAHKMAETKFEKLTGIQLDPGNGKSVIAQMAAAQYSPLRQQVEDQFDPDNKEQIPDEKILNSPIWEQGGWRPVAGFENLFDDLNNNENDKTTETGDASPKNGGNPGTESTTGSSTGGSEGRGSSADSGQPGGSANTGTESGAGADGEYTIDEASRELDDINQEEDDDYDVPFMAESSTDAALKKAQAALSKAQRELSAAEDKIAKSQASQQGMFGEASQSSMFSVEKDEAKNILNPLRENVKTARAEVDRLTAQVKDEQNQADGQLSLFSFGQDYSPSVKKQFDKVKKAIEKMFSGVKGFNGVQVLTGKDFNTSVEATGSGTEYLKNRDNVIYGFVHKGTMYINGDKLNTNTPIHEASHIFTRWAKINSPELFLAGQRLAAGTKYLSKVKADPFYQKQAENMRKKGRSEQDIEAMFRDEALAFAVGDRGAAILDQTQKNTFRNWLKNLWDGVKSFFAAGNPKIENMSAAEFSNMTFDDLSTAMAERIISGENLKSETDVSSTDTQPMATNINSKGVKMAQVVQKLFKAGTSEADIRTLLNSKGYSDLLADNIIANAKRLPKFKEAAPADPDVPAQSPTRPAELAKKEKGKFRMAMEKAKEWGGRYFTVNKGMPDFVLPLAEMTKGMQDLETNRALKSLRRLKDAAKNENFSDWDKVDKVMRGLKGVDRTDDVAMQNLFQGIPDSMAPIILNMRDQIDGLSIDLVGRGNVSPTQAILIEKNLGEYMTRAYAAFTDKNWSKNVSEKVKNDALQFIYTQEYNKLKQDKEFSTLSDDDLMAKANDIANKKVRSILDGLDLEYNPSKIKTVKGRDNGILKTRDDIPKEIRDLLGEHIDPGAAFMMTVAKLAALRSQAMFLSDVRDLGMGTIFFEKNDPNRPIEASVEFVGEGTAAWSPLGGLYSTPEVHAMFNETDPARSNFVKAWMGTIGVIRWGKTVGSVITQFKNFESNIGFAVMNGHFDITKSGDPGKYIWDQVKWWNGEKLESSTVDAAAGLGLIGQNVGIRELQDMFNNASTRKLIMAASTGNTSVLRKISKTPGQVVDYLNKIYSASDDFFKLYGFVNERNILSKAKYGMEWKDITPDQQSGIDKEAAERVKNTYPTYNRVWDGAKWISKNAPIVGNFLSFQAESIRVLMNTVQYAIKDIKDPQMRPAGWRRMAGIFAYNSARASILYYIAQATGFGIAGFLGGGDDDEEQALDDINRFVPVFMVNGEKLVRKTGKEGIYEVVDVTSLEPYGIWFKTINAARRGAGHSAEEFLGPFTEREMLFGALQEVQNNRDVNGDEIYNENSPIGNQVMDGAGYLWNKLKPSTIGMVNRLIEREDKANELMAMAGARSYTIDVVKSFSIKLANYEKEVIAKDYATKARQRKTNDPDEKAKIAEDQDQVIRDMLDDLRKDYDAAVRLGGNVEELDRLRIMAVKRVIDPMQKIDYMYLKTGNPTYLPNRYKNKLRIKQLMQK